MTKKEREKKEFDTQEEMVLYECPHCGYLTLKSLYEIRAGDTWVCPRCLKPMKVV